MRSRFGHARERKRGQSTIEIVVLIMIVAAAVLTMNRYIRRGIMARLKKSGDSLGEQFSPNHISTFEITRTVNAKFTVTMASGGTEEKQYDTYTETVTENMEFGALNEEKLF